MNKKIFGCIMTFIIISSVNGFGQEQKENLLSKSPNFKQGMKDKGTLKQTLNTGNAMKEKITRIQPGIETETNTLLLPPPRDPFVPQLPVPEIESVEELEISTESQEQEDAYSKPEIDTLAPRPSDTLEPPSSNTSESSSSEPPKPVTPPQFTISGLIWNTDRPQVILDGQILTIGDTIKSWTIVDINKQGIKVTSQNVTFIIAPSSGRIYEQ